MLLWRNGADPMISYKLGEKKIFPVDVEINCPIITLLLSKHISVVVDIELNGGPKSCAMCQYLSDNTNALINMISICLFILHALYYHVATFNAFVASLLRYIVVQKICGQGNAEFCHVFSKTDFIFSNILTFN